MLRLLVSTAGTRQPLSAALWSVEHVELWVEPVDERYHYDQLYISYLKESEMGK